MINLKDILELKQTKKRDFYNVLEKRLIDAICGNYGNFIKISQEDILYHFVDEEAENIRALGYKVEFCFSYKNEPIFIISAIQEDTVYSEAINYLKEKTKSNL